MNTAVCHCEKIVTVSSRAGGNPEEARECSLIYAVTTKQAGLFLTDDACRVRASVMRAIKCLKGVRWMPWHREAMKDVVRCDKLWGGANNL